MERSIMGWAKGFYLWTTGSSASMGRRSLMRSIFSLTERWARPMSVPQLNSRITTERPSRELEREHQEGDHAHQHQGGIKHRRGDRALHSHPDDFHFI